MMEEYIDCVHANNVKVKWTYRMSILNDWGLVLIFNELIKVEKLMRTKIMDRWKEYGAVADG